MCLHEVRFYTCNAEQCFHKFMTFKSIYISFDEKLGVNNSCLQQSHQESKPIYTNVDDIIIEIFDNDVLMILFPECY